MNKPVVNYVVRKGSKSEGSACRAAGCGGVGSPEGQARRRGTVAATRLPEPIW